MTHRIQKGQNPVQRSVFLKVHGCAHCTFAISPDLPANLRVGLFRFGSFPAWVRFSGDTLPDRPDLRSTLGLAIKLYGVPGRKILETEEDATTQDFVLQNHDVFFVDTATEMCAFTRSGLQPGGYDSYLAAHPRTKEIRDEMQKEESSVLLATYWSCLPFRFGPDRYAKYKVQPCATTASADPPLSSVDSPHYLRDDMKRRLQLGDACFAFYVQLRTGAESMPLDRATERWAEAVFPPLHVATLTLPRQDIDAPGQAAYGEHLAFTAWHALPEHAPVGSLNEARKVIYKASADRRRTHNGVPLGEPDQPHPPGPAAPVRFAIHPALGIARVGNALHDYVLAPQVPGTAPAPPHKDAAGAVKRQAALFRIYALDAQGRAVQEITAADATIEWRVHLANRKAAWYQFHTPMDLGPYAREAGRRNNSVADAARQAMVIDPGPRTIRGRNQAGPAFDTGAFLGARVYLGELRTDGQGRLLVLGGRGHAASPGGSPATTVSNNDGWHDDVADGTVRATVCIGGRVYEAEPAMVVVTPPNFAPGLQPVVSMYDVALDLFVRELGWLAPPARVSFWRDIYPIAHRLVQGQWVNHGLYLLFGHNSPSDFTASDMLARLSD
ncbi:MAG TPA: LodA/GoxA family CTQ-dependent oxidase, partial [Chloroflexota bacterium]|nr:LodA/GoxA family CTQ-dependent oxidase [Chloroflexota bacterium]